MGTEPPTSVPVAVVGDMAVAVVVAEEVDTAVPAAAVVAVADGDATTAVKMATWRGIVRVEEVVVLEAAIMDEGILEEPVEMAEAAAAVVGETMVVVAAAEVVVVVEGGMAVAVAVVAAAVEGEITVAEAAVVEEGITGKVVPHSGRVVPVVGVASIKTGPVPQQQQPGKKKNNNNNI